MTLATKITIGRMLTIPVVLWALYEGRYLLAFCVFAVASVSDAADGYIARHYGQQSVLGSILDPLADKFLLTLTFIVLTISPNTLLAFPTWLTVAVTYRDVLILLGSGIVRWFCPAMQFRPIIASKVTTVFQMVTVLAACLANLLASLGWAFLWLKTSIQVLSVITGLFCLISVLGYFRAGVLVMITEAEEPVRNEAKA